MEIKYLKMLPDYWSERQRKNIWLSKSTSLCNGYKSYMDLNEWIYDLIQNVNSLYIFPKEKKLKQKKPLWNWF